MLSKQLLVNYIVDSGDFGLCIVFPTDTGVDSVALVHLDFNGENGKVVSQTRDINLWHFRSYHHQPLQFKAATLNFDVPDPSRVSFCLMPAYNTMHNCVGVSHIQRCNHPIHHWRSYQDLQWPTSSLFSDDPKYTDMNKYLQSWMSHLNTASRKETHSWYTVVQKLLPLKYEQALETTINHYKEFQSISAERDPLYKVRAGFLVYLHNENLYVLAKEKKVTLADLRATNSVPSKGARFRIKKIGELLQEFPLLLVFSDWTVLQSHVDQIREAMSQTPDLTVYWKQWE